MVRAYDPANQADLEQHFPDTRPPSEGVFEIALAAAGGTSTGAYIAGVLDFIVEAFSCWQAARENGDTPSHRVVLRNLTGTSAGGLGVALTSLMIARDCPPAMDPRVWTQLKPPTEAQDRNQNPLFSAWVDKISLDRLLSHPDAQTGALFHAAPVDIREEVFAALAQRPFAEGRDWATTPLDVRITVGNLRGVPFALDFNNTAAQAGAVERYTMHKDHLAFALDLSASGGTADAHGPAPDAHVLDPNDFPHHATWNVFGVTAVASSSIPLVFPPQQVHQLADAYDWRGSFWRTQPLPAAAVVDLPAWSPTRPVNYAFTATDGGVFNNAPFDIAHARLAGARGRNPQSGLEARRAVILIDPLVDETASTPSDPPGLVGALLAMVMGPIAQSRLGALDLAQIKDETTYSRFMISPSRDHPTRPGVAWGPSKSLMTSPLRAILGFAHRAYREHDFLLGRRNAQAFLRNHFALPVGHSLFLGRAECPAADVIQRANGPHRPIIPLRGSADHPQPEPAWPWKALTDAEIKRLSGLFNTRFESLYKQFRDNVIPQAASSGIFKRLWQGLMTGAAKFWLDLGWKLAGRSALNKALTAALTSARDSLDPERR